MTEAGAETEKLVTCRQDCSTADSTKPHAGGWTRCVQVGRPSSGKREGRCVGVPSAASPAGWAGDSLCIQNKCCHLELHWFFFQTNGSDGGTTKRWLKPESNAFKSNYSSEAGRQASREQIMRVSNQYLLNLKKLALLNDCLFPSKSFWREGTGDNGSLLLVTPSDQLWTMAQVAPSGPGHFPSPASTSSSPEASPACLQLSQRVSGNSKISLKVGVSVFLKTNFHLNTKRAHRKEK